ncbi:hypothetical protein X798_06196 [Onchocerca flexuosa]|uniref:EF hand n=1 Tax=Onchocerca flexuosa TaxID=387005 RepID=A0A238BMZ1_9BILA|nr:hypothetical protein X798_06196 [Onchocerca flexuosa]
MFSWLGGDSSKKKQQQVRFDYLNLLSYIFVHHFSIILRVSLNYHMPIFNTSITNKTITASTMRPKFNNHLNQVLETVSDGLRKIYKQKLLPLEEYYKFHDFHSPALDDPDFDAKPMILLVGQYSTGKTTFIRYLLEEDFPGIRIGPEPTTDRFIAVMWGDDVGSIPGNALVVDSKKQFRALSSTYYTYQSDTVIIRKKKVKYVFKLRIISGNEDKIRIVLNKSDMVDHQQLMRVYGALMWSLGKVFKTPEVSRVYIGTFWDHPLHYDINRRLFQDEQHDLFSDLQALPRNAALRKLNDLIKRARLAKVLFFFSFFFFFFFIEVHAYIIAELRKQMPSMIGKEKKKKELIQNLDKIFEQLQREHNISAGDFPDINKMREHLPDYDFTKFNPIKPKLLDVRGGAFDQAIESETPFGFGKGEGFDKGANESGWVVARERYKADELFDSLDPIDGKITGRAAKEHMVKSKLPNAILGKIWKLSDVDKDGMLDSDEFALANYLINLKLEGHELPAELPKHLIPPSKREEDPIYPTLDS